MHSVIDFLKFIMHHKCVRESQKGFSLILFTLLIVVISLLIAGGAYIYKNNIQPKDINISQNNKLQVAPNTSSNPKTPAEGEEESSYGMYKIAFKTNDVNLGKCTYLITDEENNEYQIDNLIGSDTIECSEGMRLTASGKFLGDYFIYPLGSNEFVVINLKEHKKESFKISSPDRFVEVSDDFNYWLFTNPETGVRNTYSLLDRKGQVLMDKFNPNEGVNLSVFNVFYDLANKGFVFISREFPDVDTVVIKVDFLNPLSQETKTVLLTEPIGVRGMGCTGIDFIRSIKGEVIFKNDCLTFSERYKDQEGFVHVKIP